MISDPQKAPGRRRRTTLSDGGLDVVRVRGRSMLPTLRDGDLLVVSPRARARAGALAVVRLPGGRPLSVKRLGHLGGDGWWVERDNPAEGVDSWTVGALDARDVLAVALLRLWPRPRLLASRWSHRRRRD